MKATGIVRRIEEYGTTIGQKSKKPHKYSMPLILKRTHNDYHHL